MDSQRRLFLALGLSLLLTTVYMFLFQPPVEPEAPRPAEAQAPADAGLVPQLGERPTQAELFPPAPGEELPAEEVTRTVDTTGSRLVVSSVGAGLTSAELKGKKMREQRQLTLGEGYRLLAGGEVEDAPPMDMAVHAQGRPPSLAVGVIGEQPLSASLRYRLDEQQSAPGRMVFVGREGTWLVRKTLSWPDPQGQPTAAGPFELAMAVELTNTSEQSVRGELTVHYGRAVKPGTEEKASLLGGVGNESKSTCFVGDDLFHRVPEDDGPKPEKLSGPVRYFGVDQQYFLGAVFFADGPRPGRCELVATPALRAAVGHFPLEVGAGQSVVQRFGVFIGPKDVDLLQSVPSPALARELGLALGAPVPTQLQKTVDFGIWEVICVVLLFFLKFFHSVIPNWGIAIVLLTVLVKIVLLPLTFKSMVAAEQMKKLQPKVEEIRKKFGEDRERMNLEMMKLYQEAKVNPLSGCLPLLLQMPVWIALFTTLRASYEIYREPFVGPVWSDLTYKDPTYVLPVLLGVSMIITQKLQPAMLDKAQARMMTWVMPIFFTFLMLAYPAGLTLYIFTNNVLSIGQQYGLRKYLAIKEGRAPAPAAPGSKPGARKKLGKAEEKA
jgi:YidC/Oxa1 family membrane protein insertase